MKVKIKNKEKKLVAEVVLTDDRIEFNSEDGRLKVILEEVCSRGVRLYARFESKPVTIDKNDPLFIRALADMLSREGYIVDDWDDCRQKVMTVLRDFPEDEHTRELKGKMESMSRPELSSLLTLLHAQGF